MTGLPSFTEEGRELIPFSQDCLLKWSANLLPRFLIFVICQPQISPHPPSQSFKKMFIFWTLDPFSVHRYIIKFSKKTNNKLLQLTSKFVVLPLFLNQNAISTTITTKIVAEAITNDNVVSPSLLPLDLVPKKTKTFQYLILLRQKLYVVQRA